MVQRVTLREPFLQSEIIQTLSSIIQFSRKLLRVEYNIMFRNIFSEIDIEIALLKIEDKAPVA